MTNKSLDILVGKFLIEKINIDNIRLIFFIFFLAFLLIYSSHSVDSKVYEISQLNRIEKEKQMAKEGYLIPNID